MRIEQITAESVLDALRAIRYARSLESSPLLRLELVTALVEAEGLSDTETVREWAVGRVIAEQVARRLAALRGMRDSSAEPDPEPEGEWRALGEDLASGSAERAAWGLLYYRYLSVDQRPMREVVEDFGVPKRTVSHRVAHARRELVVALRDAEAASVAGRSHETPAEVADRIRVRTSSPPRERVEVLADLLRIVREDRGTISLSPEQLRRAARTPAADLTSYRLSRIAQWSRARYRLDRRFVDMALWVDLGRESRSGRWRPLERRFRDLRAVLEATEDPAFVLLGPPGSGKSTLLRRLDLDVCADTQREAGADGGAPIPYFVSLNRYRTASPSGPPPAPLDWLCTRWGEQHPLLPPLERILADGKALLLLDGLNEIPHRSHEEYLAHVGAWKQFLHEILATSSGNRALLACRSLDYATPLSTPSLRVPQLRMEPLSHGRIQSFLRAYRPHDAEHLWRQLVEADMLEAVRWPFFLRLVVEQEDDASWSVKGIASLLTTFVRRALRREVERDNPRLAQGALLTRPDIAQLLRGPRREAPLWLPEHGPLFGALSRLAHGLQRTGFAGEACALRFDAARAHEVLGTLAEPVLSAAESLGLIDEDGPLGDFCFRHQLIQEYFAARRFSEAPDPRVAHVEWRADRVVPGVPEAIDGLAPADPLPEPPRSGWEETLRLAVTMAPDPARLLRELQSENLTLAGRIACELRPRERAIEDLVPSLCEALIARSRDPAADLRHRIACGRALGELGDPRLEQYEGPFGDYLLPPLVDIAGGRYLIGAEPDEEPASAGSIDVPDAAPVHRVRIASFAMARFPITNAEWRCFLESGGYEHERWWLTAAARDWRLGRGTSYGNRGSMRNTVARFRDHPEQIDDYQAIGTYTEEVADLWRRRVAMSAQELEAHLEEQYPERRLTEPRWWHHERGNHPAQPVAAISWYEATAYCAWLTAQSGIPFRLPTEVEWEAAARGLEGRRYSFGDRYVRLCANTLETHVQRASPIGAFPLADTPKGITDLMGNVATWTSSAFSEGLGHGLYAYPYTATDGREAADRVPGVLRSVRGGGWNSVASDCRAAVRHKALPSLRISVIGARLVTSASAADRSH